MRKFLILAVLTACKAHDGTSSAEPSLPMDDATLYADLHKTTNGRLDGLDTQTNEWKADSIRITSTIPVGGKITRANADVVAKDFVQSTVTSLMAHGWNPHDKHTTIYWHMHGATNDKSPTGEELIRNYGKASYDPYADAVTWK